MAFIAIQVDCLCSSFLVMSSFWFICILRFLHESSGFDS
jgi:hypothetical protein